MAIVSEDLIIELIVDSGLNIKLTGEMHGDYLLLRRPKPSNPNPRGLLSLWTWLIVLVKLNIKSTLILKLL